MQEVASASFIEEFNDITGKMSSGSSQFDRPAFELRLSTLDLCTKSVASASEAGSPPRDTTLVRADLSGLVVRAGAALEPLACVDSVRCRSKHSLDAAVVSVSIVRPEMKASAAQLVGIAALVKRLRKTFEGPMKRLLGAMPAMEPRELLRSLPVVELRTVVHWLTVTWRTA